MSDSDLHKPFRSIVGRVCNDVVDGRGKLKEVFARLSISTVKQIGRYDVATGSLEHASHSAIATSWLQYFSFEFFIVDQRVSGPRRRWKEIGSFEISEPLQRRLK